MIDVSAEFALPTPELPVIDENRLLNEFGGDASILAELRDLFMEHVPPQFEAIEKAVAEGDAETLSKEAHSLKGACATYGAPRLSLICKSAELAARAGDVEIVQANMDQLREEFQKVVEAISSVGTAG
jgi:HPt (histidine-containing phosphotransfer) domain-containing protein